MSLPLLLKKKGKEEERACGALGRSGEEFTSEGQKVRSLVGGGGGRRGVEAGLQRLNDPLRGF